MEGLAAAASTLVAALLPARPQGQIRRGIEYAAALPAHVLDASSTPRELYGVAEVVLSPALRHAYLPGVALGRVVAPSPGRNRSSLRRGRRHPAPSRTMSLQFVRTRYPELCGHDGISAARFGRRE